MMRCELCNGELRRIVSDSWELYVEKPVKSGNHYRANKFAYTGDTNTWERLLSEQVQRMQVWEAEDKRRCTFTRLVGPRGQLFDTFNLHAGLKSVVDAMVRLNVLVDDDPRWFEGYVRQRRHHHHGLIIRIEDLER